MYHIINKISEGNSLKKIMKILDSNEWKKKYWHFIYRNLTKKMQDKYNYLHSQ